MTTAHPTCLEVVRFKLLPGVTDEAFLATNAATVDFLKRQGGFRRRVLSKGADGVWTDVVEWENLALAHQAAKQLMTEPALGPFMKAIDPESVMMDHLDIALRIE
jgi:hypothetical protein